MHIIEERDKVTLAFTGKLDNGQLFKEIPPENPIEITIGQSELPPTIEIGITGLKKGDRKTIRVPPEEGYGPRLKELVHKIPVSAFSDKLTPRPGMVLSQKVEKDGEQHDVPVTIIEVNEESITIDYNHPAAGHHLTYEIIILQILKNS